MTTPEIFKSKKAEQSNTPEYIIGSDDLFTIEPFMDGLPTKEPYRSMGMKAGIITGLTKKGKQLLGKNGSGFPKLYDFDIPGQIGEYQVAAIDACVFQNCHNLRSVNIPEEVHIIETIAFNDCPNLVSLSLSDSVMEFSYRSILNCPNLKDITIGEHTALRDFKPIGFGFSNIQEFNFTRVPLSNKFIQPTTEFSAIVAKQRSEYWKEEREY